MSWLARHRLPGIVSTAAALVALTATLAPVLGEDELVAVVLIYLLVALIASALWGYVAGLASAVAGSLVVNFFFVEPIHTFTVAEPRHVAALAVFLTVALIGATMLALLREQVALVSAERRRAMALLDLSRNLAGAASPDDAMHRLCVAALRAFGAGGCTVLTSERTEWRVVASAGQAQPMSRDSDALANTAVESNQPVRTGASSTSRLASRLAPGPEGRTFVPLVATGVRGVLVVDGLSRSDSVGELLGGFADEAGLALQRATLARQARDVEVLREADAFKATLLSSVSHDLRSPLTAVKAAVGSLRSQALAFSDEDRDSLLEIIESQTDRLTAVVSDLLEMSRIEGGAVAVKREPVTVEDLLSEVVDGTKGVAAGRRIRIEAESASLLGDRGLLLLALTNLTENACRYAAPGTPVTLRATTSGSRVRIDVADEGPGIPAEELPRIFDKFYRGATGKKTTGTGLGLAIARALVERSGGALTATSSPDGTVFTLDLPAATLRST